MANKIQFKRGVKANLPTLSVGEPAFTTDTKEFFIGDGTTNIRIKGAQDINGDMKTSVYDTTMKQTDVYAYADSKVGDLTTLTTGNKTDAVSAIKELNSDLQNQKLLINGFVASATVFNKDGSILETNDLGTIVTIFNTNGSITKVLSKADSSKITLTTIFNQDGSITEVIS